MIGKTFERVSWRARCTRMLQIDNGSEFCSKAKDSWVHRHSVLLKFV